MQNEPQIEIYRELSCNCGSKTDVKKGCSCNSGKKININPCTPEHFAVVNYFSELVHEWEKEAARHNLGISELEGIEYVTDTGEDGEILTKVIFKYRKGYEFYTREFRVAPQGEKGDKGDKGNPGEKGDKGDDGHTPVLSKVSVNWVNDCTEEGGQFVERHGVYDLQLNLKKPDTIQQLESIIRDINNILVNNYVNKSELTNLATKQELGQFAKLSDIKDYSLVYGAGVLTLLKNGAVHSQVNILTPEERYTGNITVFQKTNSRTTPPDIIGENYSRYGWTKGIPDIDIEGEEYIWMAQCWVEKGIYGSWSVTCITGQNGEDGKDGNAIEYVYKRFSSELLTPSQHVPNIQEGTSRSEKPIATGGWTDHPQGVTKELPYEYFSFSTWQQEVGEWSSFSIPVIWSHFGQNGHDGDGVQYIFKIADSAPANPTPSDINIAAYQNGKYVPSGWTDNPRNLTTQGQKQWVCVRKYHSVNGQMKWDAYEGPTLWNYFPKDGESSTPGLEGAVIRNRGLWSDQNTYYGNDFEPNGNIKYIDIVTYAPVGDNLHYYKCIKTVTPNDNANPTNATYWTEADEIDFSYINTLISEYAQINYFNSREVRVVNANNKIVAGMTSGNQAEGDPSITNNNNVRIWAGNTYKNDNNIDLNLAPFRVYSNGKVVANDVIVSGQLGISDTLFKVNSNIELPKAQSGLLAYLYVDDGNEHEIKCNDSKLYLYTGSEFENANRVTIKDNGIYFIVGFKKEIDSVVEQFWAITHTVFKVVNQDTVFETEQQEIKGTRNSIIDHTNGERYIYRLSTTENIIFENDIEEGPYLNVEPLRNWQITLRTNDQDQNPISVSFYDYYKEHQNEHYKIEEENERYSLELTFNFFELTNNIDDYEMCVIDDEGNSSEYIKMTQVNNVKAEMNMVFSNIKEMYGYYKSTNTTYNAPTYHITSNGLIISNEGTVVGEVNENTVINYTDTIYKISVNNTTVQVTSKYNGDYAELTNLDSTELEGPNNN